jgi:hypothetical protein
MNMHRPSQAELDGMIHAEKDALILFLFGSSAESVGSSGRCGLSNPLIHQGAFGFSGSKNRVRF